MKTETCKHYSRVFGIFLPNFIKIDSYNFELYRFKVGAFSTHCTMMCYINQHFTTCSLLVDFDQSHSCVSFRDTPVGNEYDWKWKR